MASQPSSLPRWATSPPGGSITPPTSLQMDEGYQPTGSTTFPDGKPIRQIMNWFKNLVYQWIAWFAQTLFRPLAAFANNQILDADSLLPAEFIGPAWPRSSTVPSAWFTGAAIIQGFFHRVASPGFTFTNSRDTYVDLGPDGVWDFNAVANGAGAPSLAADHVRFFMFVTNGSAQITAGTYFKAGLNWIENQLPFRFNAGAIIDSAEGMAFDRIGNLWRVLHDAGDTSGGATTPEINATNEVIAGRLGTMPAGADEGDHYWMICANCRRTSTGWARGAYVGPSYVYVLSDAGCIVLRHDDADGATWDNLVNTGDWAIVGAIGAVADRISNVETTEDGDVIMQRDLAVGRNLTVAADLQVNDDVVVVGDTEVEDLFVNQDLDVDGIAFASEFQFAPSRTRTIRIPFSKADWGNLQGGTNPPDLGALQPGASQGNAWTFDTQSSGGGFDFCLPVELPDGCTVTACRVICSVLAGSSTPLHVALMRHTQGSGGNNESMRSTNGGITDIAATQAQWSEIAVTVDQNNVINTDTYSYYFLAQIDSDVSGSICAVEIDVTESVLI